jgi:hypothetical protein
MELPKKVTCDVKLRLSDVIDPFAFNWINLFNLVLTIFACVVIFRPSSIYGPYPVEAWEEQAFYIFIAFSWLMFVGLPYASLLIRFWTTPALKSPRKLTFDADGMHLESDDARGDYKWSLFRSVAETKKVFVFKISATSGTYLPKRCLTGPDDIHLLRQLIRESFRGKKSLRND